MLYYYLIYRITNLVNNKIYVGKHKTQNIEDGYLGSGKLIVAAIKKYGINNFNREILYILNTEDEMDFYESVIVTEDFINRTDTYNLVVGGKGGFSYINKNKLGMSSEKGKAMNKKYLEKTSPDVLRERALHAVKISRNNRTGLFAEDTIERRIKSCTTYWKGRKHTEEHIAKMKETKKKNINKCLGEANSQFGTMWITDGISSNKIKVGEEIPKGWKKGRVIKT
jgi:hypothetical protein